MEDIRGVRLRKFRLIKIVLGVRMHFHHICSGFPAGCSVEDTVHTQIFFTTRSTGHRRHELKLYKPQPAGSVGYHNFLQLDYTGVEWISSALCIHITRCKNGPKSSQSPVVIIVLHVTRITR